MCPNNLSAPRRITASNLPLPTSAASDDQAEPGIEVKIETREPEGRYAPSLERYLVATAKHLNLKIISCWTDAHCSRHSGGNIPLDEVPGLGIVLPGGVNLYYLDIAPDTDGTMHRTTSIDYLVVLQDEVTLGTPDSAPYSLKDGKTAYGKPVETVARPGEVILQRGIMHALSNRTNTWVRILAVVVAADPNRVPIESNSSPPAIQAEAGVKLLKDEWLQD
ncbi:hypothetical protein BJ170DRAFT_598160 [Xylariales sp. AK1849]|nr:hypothetical protein BJ170DRAFT_598160 [Xylariales sp. AK1849]